MPKATKKKAEKVADFKKAKLKLGKGKKAASNATDTSFKARSIALPSQKQLSRALKTTDDAGEPAEAGPSSAIPATASGLTLDDVLVQARHVNAHVRKEALAHLRDVLSAGVALGVPMGERHGEVAKVMRAVGGSISDDDPVVRKALHEFLAWYISRLPAGALAPYLPLVQLQLSSALSHIFPAIRIDACRLVELLLESYATDIVARWPAKVPSDAAAVGASAVPTAGSTIFDGLRLSAGLGEEKGASTQGGFRLTAASKLVILRTIKTFVARALEASAPPEIAAPARPAPVLGEWTLSEINAIADQWSMATTGDWALAQENKEMSRADLTTGEGVMEELSSTYLALHSLLLATFMEAAPSAFPPSSATVSASVDDVSLNLCSVCTELVWVFARTLLPSDAFSTLPTCTELRAAFSDFLKRMTAWFPFNKASQAASGPGELQFGLSLMYAKLAAALAPAPPRITLARGRDGWRPRVRAINAAWAGMKEKEGPNAVAFRLAGEWVEDCLAPSTDALAPTLGAQAYADLLPVVRTLAVRPGPALEAFAESALRLQGSSTKRRSADALLAELLWVHEDRFSPLPFFVPPNSAARTALTTWLSAAPRTLWELGARDPVASDALLSLLREIAVRAPSFSRPFSLVNPADLPPIAGKLGPFFHLAHPSRGPIQGPWAKLPEHTQRLALDVARLWMPLEPRLAESVAAAVRGTWAEAYWDR